MNNLIKNNPNMNLVIEALNYHKKNIKYSCKYSNENYDDESFAKQLKKHSDELQNALIVDCSHNKLENLVLKNYRELQTIVASNNFIKKVELNLIKLKNLDLSFNKLEKVPNFSNIP